MWTIKLQDEVQKSEYHSRPILRDNEWIVFNAILAAQGFSGFAGDKNITCHRIVKKHYDSVENKRDRHGQLITLNKLEQRELDTLDNIRKSNGDFKEYVEAYEYLKRTFDKPLGKPLYDNKVKNLLYLSCRASGKDLEENSTVYTPQGIVKIKDIQVGDSIYGRDGELTKVLSKDNYYDQVQYKITLQDGRTVECGGGHLWNAKTPGRDKHSEYRTLTTKFLYDNINKRVRNGIRGKSSESYWFLPLNEPIKYEKKELPIDPYFLGVWLGDGSKNRVGVTTPEPEIVDLVYKIADQYGSFVHVNQNAAKTCPTYHITDGNTAKAKRELNNEFKTLNLFHNKHIPDIYLNGSVEQRIELLKGLMDTDGSCSKSCEFTTSTPALFEGVKTLLSGLGIYYSTAQRIPTFTYKGEKKKGKLNYRIILRPTFCPFNLPRKITSFEEVKHRCNDCVGIKTIEEIGVKPSVCIGVDNKDSLFLTNNCIVTHNSFSLSALGGHEFSFDGLKYYVPLSKTKTQSGVFVGAADSNKSTELIEKIRDGLKELPGSYGEGDDFIPSPFFKQTKGTWDEGGTIEHSYKVQEGGGWKNKGTGSKIKHGNFGANTHAAVGGRRTKIFVEEIGELDKVETVHAANERVLKVGNSKFGMELGIGTGGNVKFIAGIKKLYYNTEQYDYYDFPDHWENSGRIGLFLPATYAYNELKDENGNTDLEAALDLCVEERNKKAAADTTLPLDMEIMYHPLKPSEIFLNPNENIFPVALLRSRQVHLEINNLFKAKAQFGELEPNRDGKIRWFPDMTLKPITTYRVDDRMDLRGSVVIYEHPGDLIKPLYGRSLYKIGYDVVGSENGGTSLASILVYKGMPDIIRDPSEMRNTIVAEYIGRLNRVDDLHEIAVRLAKYYNARILFETNVPGFLTYCRLNGNLDLLQPTPAAALAEIYSGDFKKGQFGVRMTEKLKEAADLKTKAWFHEVIETDSDGLAKKFNVDSIYSPRFLDEYINYDGIGNFDHISTFRLIQLWLMDEKSVPITETAQGKKDNAIMEMVLAKREDGFKKFLTY
jgi:hypothetical protein